MEKEAKITRLGISALTNVTECTKIGTPVDYQQKLCLAHKTVQIWL